MNRTIVYLLMPLLLVGCSKNATDISPSAALPFTVIEVKTDDEKEMDKICDQSLAFLNAREYEKLDELAAKLRSSKEHYVNGLWKLSTVYSGVALSDNQPDSKWEKRVAEIRAWISAKPNSITARVALAYVLVDYAWKARRGGFGFQSH